MLEKHLNNRFFIICLIPSILGALTVLSFQPFNFTIINLIIFPLLFYLINYINKKSKVVFRKKPYKINLFLLGLFFGFGFYLSGISWITNSLTFDNNFKVLIPFAIIFIPLFLSLFMAFTILLVGPHLKFNFHSILLLASSLAISDYIRSKILTGFPWNLWAYSTVWMRENLQILNDVGLYAYNLFVITIFIFPVILLFNLSLFKKCLYLISVSSILLSLFIYGNYQINQNNKKLKDESNKIFVKIISPNFELEYGLSAIQIKERLNKLIRFSEPDRQKKTLFIWPEGVFSGYSYDEIKDFKKIFSDNFSKEHLIIFGTNKLDPSTGNFFNSMLIVDKDFEIIQGYNKLKLVPFGEFVPFEKFLSKFGLKKITEGYGSFEKGAKNVNLKINKADILPLICYEVIFTELLQKSDRNTNIIINISEDGWFGQSIGPDQHFSKSIFRAIENNTFFLRSANKGISAVIDNKGNIVKQLNRNEAGSIEFEVPLIKSNKIKNDLIFFVLLFTYLFTFVIFKKNEK